MQILFRLLLATFLGLVCIASKSSVVLAAEGFETQLQANYVVHSNGDTTVKKIFTITNQKSIVYLQRYGLEIGSGKLKDVKVYNSSGPLTTNVVQTDQKTTIGIQFSEKTVGRGQRHEFILEYTDPEIAVVAGQSLAIHIPALENASDITQYDVTLQTPPSFAQPSYTKPTATHTESTSSFTTVQFLNDSGKEGIWINFGQEQRFLLDLTYTLKNTSGGQNETQIVLPSDTAFQRVTFIDISPQPEYIQADADGNWIASYMLNSDEETVVHANALIQTSVTAVASHPQLNPQPAHTTSQPYWPTNHTLLQQVKHNYPTAMDIYDFVRTNLIYAATPDQPHSIDQLMQTGANGNAHDFTNLFISLARTNKIPTRRVYGMVIHGHPRLRPTLEDRHIWAEYFDTTTKTWKMSDPLWANTSGGEFFAVNDINRVALLHQGVSPNTPNLEGAGKLTEARLHLDQTLDNTPSEPALELALTNSLSTALIGQKPILLVTNLTGQAWYKLPIEIDFQADRPDQKITLPDLLPYQTIEFPLDIYANTVTNPETIEASIRIHANQLTANIRPASILTKYRLDKIDGMIIATGVVMGVLASIFTFVKLQKRSRRQKKAAKKKS